MNNLLFDLIITPSCLLVLAIIRRLWLATGHVLSVHKNCKLRSVSILMKTNFAVFLMSSKKVHASSLDLPFLIVGVFSGGDNERTFTEGTSGSCYAT